MTSKMCQRLPSPALPLLSVRRLLRMRRGLATDRRRCKLKQEPTTMLLRRRVGLPPLSALLPVSLVLDTVRGSVKPCGKPRGGIHRLRPICRCFSRPSAPMRESFCFRAPVSWAGRITTLLPVPVVPLQGPRADLPVVRSSVLRWGQLAPASRFATSAAALAAGKAKTRRGRPSVPGSIGRKLRLRMNPLRAFRVNCANASRQWRQ